jgi:hypothetical protein
VVHEFAAAKRTASKSSAGHFTASMQTEAFWLVNVPILFAKRDCVMPVLRENSLSVRGYGLRTYEPRQGRNAATVV